MKKIQLQLIDGFKFNWADGYLTAFGIDARHYLPVLKHSILAFRVGAGFSLGSEKILYYLGGADNEIIPQFNDQQPSGYRYYSDYQSVEPNLRDIKSYI